MTAEDDDNDKAPDNDATEIGDSILVDNNVPSDDTDRDTRAVADADSSPLATVRVTLTVADDATVTTLGVETPDTLTASDARALAPPDALTLYSALATVELESVAHSDGVEDIDADRDIVGVSESGVGVTVCVTVRLLDTLVDTHIVLVALVDVLSDGDDDIDAESDGEVVALSDMDTDADADADTLGDAELDDEPSPDSLGPPDALAASVGATVKLVRCVPLMEPSGVAVKYDAEPDRDATGVGSVAEGDTVVDVHSDSERDDTGDTETLSVTDCDDDSDSSEEWETYHVPFSALPSPAASLLSSSGGGGGLAVSSSLAPPLHHHQQQQQQQQQGADDDVGSESSWEPLRR